MLRKLEMTRAQYAAFLAGIILVSLSVVLFSGLVESGVIVLFLIMTVVYAGIIPFLLGVAVQAIFWKWSIPSCIAWALALIVVAVQWIYKGQYSIGVLENAVLSLLVSFLISGIFINSGLKSFRAFVEGRRSKKQESDN